MHSTNRQPVRLVAASVGLITAIVLVARSRIDTDPKGLSPSDRARPPRTIERDDPPTEPRLVAAEPLGRDGAVPLTTTGAAESIWARVESHIESRLHAESLIPDLILMHLEFEDPSRRERACAHLVKALGEPGTPRGAKKLALLLLAGVPDERVHRELLRAMEDPDETLAWVAFTASGMNPFDETGRENGKKQPEFWKVALTLKAIGDDADPTYEDRFRQDPSFAGFAEDGLPPDTLFYRCFSPIREESVRKLLCDRIRTGKDTDIRLALFNLLTLDTVHPRVDEILMCREILQDRDQPKTLRLGSASFLIGSKDGYFDAKSVLLELHEGPDSDVAQRIICAAGYASRETRSLLVDPLIWPGVRYTAERHLGMAKTQGEYARASQVLDEIGRCDSDEGVKFLADLALTQPSPAARCAALTSTVLPEANLTVAFDARAHTILSGATDADEAIRVQSRTLFPRLARTALLSKSNPSLIDMMDRALAQAKARAASNAGGGAAAGEVLSQMRTAWNELRSK
ncbi:MAG: hypothetical protein HYY93_12380 [Planctomycetes bacterium]|nr:hypothetical protein [Planctomycetota bacterium]